jgi:carboxypeptidase C (cathepsin A)
MGQYSPGYIAAFNQYLSGELGIHGSDEYIAINLAEVNSKWIWSSEGSKGSKDNFRPDFSPRLASAMRRNPAMRLLVMAGYYDLVTPAGEAAYVLHHSGLPDDRTEMKLYESGHMVYLGGTIRKVADDIRKFVNHK